MPNLDFSKLNSTEQHIHETIRKASCDYSSISITQAANLCECSVSKVSKFTKKLGFSGYKDYMNFIYQREQKETQEESELDRIRRFIDDFDISLVDNFVTLIQKYEKVILFGYGPSHLCTQYFEYMLRVATDKVVIAVPDEMSARQLIDEKTLFVIFTTTGQFKSFESIYDFATEKKCEVMILMEEYHPSMLEHFDKVMILTDTIQKGDFPYEKSRSVFFIFIAEVIRKLLVIKKTKEE